MGKFSVRKRFPLVMLVCYTGIFMTVAASSELPLLQPVDHVDHSTVGSGSTPKQTTQRSWFTGRLAGNYFTYQESCSPSGSRLAGHDETRHHRIVHEHEAGNNFHLRGNPSPINGITRQHAPPTSQAYIIVDVVGRKDGSTATVVEKPL